MTTTRPWASRPWPGEFRATCNLTVHKPEVKLTPEERREAKERDLRRIYNDNLDKPRWEVAFPACGGFETEDQALFEGHMLTAHGAKPGTCRGVTGTFSQRLPRQIPKRGKSVWNGPRLTEEGTAFEPTGLEPGAVVTWRELVATGETDWDPANAGAARREWVERSGQVWSKGWANRSVWVIPFEKLEGEAAVLVCEDRDSLRHHSTYTIKRAA